MARSKGTWGKMSIWSRKRIFSGLKSRSSCREVNGQGLWYPASVNLILPDLQFDHYAFTAKPIAHPHHLLWTSLALTSDFDLIHPRKRRKPSRHADCVTEAFVRQHGPDGESQCAAKTSVHAMRRMTVEKMMAMLDVTSASVRERRNWRMSV